MKKSGLLPHLIYFVFVLSGAIIAVEGLLIGIVFGLQSLVEGGYIDGPLHPAIALAASWSLKHLWGLVWFSIVNSALFLISCVLSTLLKKVSQKRGDTTNALATVERGQRVRIFTLVLVITERDFILYDQRTGIELLRWPRIWRNL